MRIKNETRSRSRTKLLAMMMVAVMMIAGFVALVPTDQNDADSTHMALYGIGRNDVGQQGNGTTTNVTTPTQIGSFINVTSVICSNKTTFFIDSGKLYGMGLNDVGQQGNGTTTNVTTPTQIGSTLGTITDVVCSSSTTFFLTSDGKLYGMGSNSQGQQGNGTSGSGTNVLTPTQIGSSLGTITDVVCSDTTTFFLTSDGKLYGMGDNYYGQIGNGTSGSGTDVNTPTQIGSFTNVTFVDCSMNTTFFIDSGKLYGMGSNNHGQQGKSTSTTKVTTPTQIGSFTNVTSVCSPDYVTTFIDSGKLYGMGYNYYGQQGHGTTGSDVTTPVQIGSFTNVTFVASSSSNTFFIDSGKLYGIGRNAEGLIGNGTLTDCNIPTQTSFAGNVIDIYYHNNNTCYFMSDDYKLYGMGNNLHGQLGDVGERSSTPVLIYELSSNSDVYSLGHEVFFTIPVNCTVSIESSNTSYGTVSSASITDITDSDTISISGNTITYGSGASAQTVTATPASASYKFLGWQISNGDFINTSYTVTNNVTINAIFGSADSYLYVMNYTDEQINSVDVMLPSSTTTTHVTTAKNSIWNFDSTTGVGPFNSYYLAVKKTDGTKGYVLNPNNLAQKLNGSSYTMADYNILWVIPTVYWSATDTQLVISDESSLGTAYAHTIGGSVRPYIGIGVYEAGSEEVNSTTMLTSQSGVSPLENQTITAFDTYAHNANGNTILWNFYQWTFTKMATYMVGMGKNSQEIWGAGLTGGSASATTGLGNASGPYVSNATTYSKVFIENTWGSVNEWVGDMVFSNRVLYAGQNASDITYNSTNNKTYSGVSIPSSNGWITVTSKSSAYWDLPTASTSASNATSTSVPGDRVASDSSMRVLCVGGNWNGDTSAGVASAGGSANSSYAGASVGSRLAYYFDAEPIMATTTVTVQSNNTSYGTVDVSSVQDAEVGSTITVSNNTITIGSTTITATPKSATAQYTYAFDNWSVANNATVTENMTITATFSQTTNTYTITWKNYDDTTLTTSNVAYGTTPTYTGATPTKPSTAQYSYAFDAWSPSIVAVTGDATYTATFTETLRSYTITWKNYDNTTLETDQNVPYGTTPTYDGETPVKPSTSEYRYTFNGWSPAITAVSGDATYTAQYTEGPNTYNVTVVANNNEYGTITNGTFTDVPYGTSITISDNTVTIGSLGTATATKGTDDAQYTYGFTGFTVSPTGSTVTADTTITANFTRAVNQYTITWSIDGTDTEQTYDYGATPTHANPTKTGYTFTGWNPAIATVTQDQTYTAQFQINTYTIIWSIDGVTTTETYNYGATPTHADPTKVGFTFTGWNPAIATVTQDQTYTAQFTIDTYNVTYDATTNGGDSDPEAMTGTVETAVTLPSATKEGKYFNGWFTQPTNGTRVGFSGDLYYPTQNITLYAQFVDTPVFTFSLNFNVNGGYYGPGTVTQTAEQPGTMELTIPDTVPSRFGFTFLGWSSEAGSVSATYVAGDTITVSSGEPVTLYAIWQETNDHEAFMSIVQVLPILIVVGLLISVVGTIFRFGGEKGIEFTGEFNMGNFVKMIVGVAIAILVIAVVLIPILEGL